MGLDQYLEKRRYLSSFNEKDKLLAREINKLMGIDPYKADPLGDSGVKEVTVAACYFRKANAIHGWFIRNCADEVDDCRPVEVQQEQLKELYDLCKKVLKTKDASLLSPQEGFFFGSTEIDEGYWHVIKDTIKILKRELDFIKVANANKECWDYYYHASW